MQRERGSPAMVSVQSHSCSSLLTRISPSPTSHSVHSPTPQRLNTTHNPISFTPPPLKKASLYLAGVGVEVDRKKGIEYARIGAKKGDALCQAQLAMLLLTSGDESGVLDFRGAAEWYHAAALQG